MIEKVLTSLKTEFAKNKLSQVQIHFAGTQRSGKTTLATIACEVLKTMGSKPIIVDVDVTRTSIFANDEPSIGSPLQHLMQAWTYRAIFEIRLPDIIRAGGIPITAATHSRVSLYQDAKATAKKLGVPLKFIILETPTLEEVSRRSSQKGEGDRSDMDVNDPQAKKVYLDTIERFKIAYGNFQEPHCFVEQEEIIDMAKKAMQFILQ